MTSLETLDTALESSWIWTVGSYRSHLRTVIEGRMLKTWWQPIADLNGSGRYYGHVIEHRLSHPAFSSVDELFTVAEALDMHEALETQIYARLAALLTRHPAGTLYVPCRPADLQRLVEGDDRLVELMRERADQVVLELPEPALYLRPALRESIERVRARGFGFALSRVGTVCTDLGRIERLEPDLVKLDPTFVRGIHRASCPQLWVQVLASICTHRQILVCADGLEDDADRACLRSLGCHAGQGPLCGAAKPVTVSEELE